MTRENHVENLKDIMGSMPDDTCGDWRNSIACAIKELEQEPCEDAISRQAVLECLTATKLKKFDFILNAREEIKKLPPVNPQPKTGHWIEDEMKVWCSECGEENDRCSKCCPNCGVRMIEPQERSDKE